MNTVATVVKEQATALIIKQIPVIIEAAKGSAPVIIETVKTKVIESAVVLSAPLIIEKAGKAPTAMGVSATAMIIPAGIVHKNAAKKAQIAQKRNNNKLQLCEEKKDEEHKMDEYKQQLNQKENELEEIKQKIDNEKSKIFNLENARNDENTKFIVMLGITGDGKSTVCNRLCDDKFLKGDKGPFEAKRGAKSETTFIKHKECKMDDTECVIVDTPGCCDSNGDDIQHSNNLAAYLYGCGGVNAFVLVKDGGNQRLNSNLQEILKDYEKQFGREFWKHLIIIFTKIEPHLYDEFDDVSKSFLNEIHNKFGQSRNYEIPAIPLGFDTQKYDFDKFNSDFIGQVGFVKLKCNKMMSPIKEKQEEKIELDAEIEKLKNNMNISNNKIINLTNSIQSIQGDLDNPEWIALGRNING